MPCNCSSTRPSGRSGLVGMIVCASGLLTIAPRGEAGEVEANDLHRFQAAGAADKPEMLDSSQFHFIRAYTYNINADPRVSKSTVPPPSPYWTIPITTPVPAGPYKTPLTTSKGKRYWADAVAKANVTGLLLNLALPVKVLGASVDMAGSFASIGNAPNSATKPDEDAIARATVFDPMMFSVSESDQLRISAGLTAGTMFRFQLDQPEEWGEAGLSFSQSTDLPGLEQLTSCSVTIAGRFQTSPSVDVFFWSNPLLGLDDQQIAADFRNQLSFDSSTGIVNLVSNFSLYDITLTIPAGISTTSVSTLSETSARLSTVPEASSLLQLATGCLAIGLIRRGWWWGR